MKECKVENVKKGNWVSCQGESERKRLKGGMSIGNVKKSKRHWSKEVSLPR